MSEPTPAGDLPEQARRRLAEMRERRLFTSDLSVSEFLLVKEAGFEPVGLVMGTSIYQVATQVPTLHPSEPGRELADTTRALREARELAMNRMEEEADALGADGVVGVRLTVNLSTDPQRAAWKQYRAWTAWARRVGLRRPPTVQQTGWFAAWSSLADAQWSQWCRRMGWTQVPLPPWSQPRSQAAFAWGANAAEFIALGTAVRHTGGESYRNKHGRPFQSDLSGQDFWMLIRSGYRPVGFVMGNCVYYVPPGLMAGSDSTSRELAKYTHALYDAREVAIERLQDEAEALGAAGVVGVTVAEREHSWRAAPQSVGNAALQNGEVIELFVIGTAVVPTGGSSELAATTELVLCADDPATAGPREGDDA